MRVSFEIEKSSKPRDDGMRAENINNHSMQIAPFPVPLKRLLLGENTTRKKRMVLCICLSLFVVVCVVSSLQKFV